MLTGAVVPAALAGSVISAPAMAAEPVPIRHYLFVRVDTGDPGDLASDASVTAMAPAVAHYWAGIDNAPPLTITVVHQTLKGASTYPSCGFDVGRRALKAAGIEASDTDGVVTFLRSGYTCNHYTAHADGDLDVEAFGGPPLLTWKVVAHEIGHNLGLCANTVHDRQAPSRWTPAIFTGETSYGNPFSIMGGGEGPPSAPCQEAAAWMRATLFPASSTARVRSLENAGDQRAWEFLYGGSVYTIEYRARAIEAPSLGPHAGVVIYKDGLVLETLWDTYATPKDKTVKLSKHQAITVTATARSYALVKRISLP